MNIEQFQEPWRVACAELGVAPAPMLDGRTWITLDDVDLAVVVEPPSEPRKMFCYADVAPLREGEAGVCERLLAINLSAVAHTNGTVALDTATRRVFWVLRRQLSPGETAGRIVTTLRQATSQALAIRKQLTDIESLASPLGQFAIDMP